MQCPHIRFSVLAGILSLAFLAMPAQAQEKSERVKFDTVDGVAIKGKFYPAARNAPVVMLLHAFDSDSRTKDWTKLAEALQLSNFAVLAFDFRGHGESTEVNPAVFWQVPMNRNSIKNFKPDRAEIDAKDFKLDYRPLLVNDIAAAKAFLDRKNDINGCNTGATIVIGAEEGATLGAIWMNSEMYRYRMILNMFKGTLELNTFPEGKDVCGCLWLTPAPKLGSFAVSLEKTLYLSGKVGEVPMVFMHGESDTEGKKIAKRLESYMKEPKDKGKLKFTGAFEIKGTKLSGAGLLKSTNTSQLIIDWLNEVKLAKGREWADRDFRKSQYYWRSAPAGGLIPAKVNVMDLNMNFDTYMKYIQR